MKPGDIPHLDHMTQSEARIRKYRDDDLDAVLACFSASVRGIGARHYTPVQVEVWAPNAPDADAWRARLGMGRTFIADLGGAVGGFVRVEERGYIDLLYVHPQFERRGLGRRLLQEACSWAAGRGAVKLESEVSIGARPLFEACGFRVDSQQTVERRGVQLMHYRMSRRSAAWGHSSFP
jgi:putative acetyltransferase